MKRPGDRDRVLAALRSGPNTVRAIATRLEMASGRVSNTIQGLLKRGMIRRIETGKRNGLYEAIPDATERSILRGEDYRAAEEAYVRLRRAGKARRVMIGLLAISETAADRFELAYIAQTSGAHRTDSSSPKFAHDDKHLKAVVPFGGYPAFSERRWGMGQAAAVEPIFYPMAGVADGGRG